MARGGAAIQAAIFDMDGKGQGTRDQPTGTMALTFRLSYFTIVSVSNLVRLEPIIKNTPACVGMPLIFCE